MSVPLWPGNADGLVGLLLADADVGAPRGVLKTANGMSVPLWRLYQKLYFLIDDGLAVRKFRHNLADGFFRLINLLTERGEVKGRHALSVVKLDIDFTDFTILDDEERQQERIRLLEHFVDVFDSILRTSSKRYLPVIAWKVRGKEGSELLVIPNLIDQP